MDLRYSDRERQFRDELRRWLDEVRVVDDLPLTSMLKVDKRALAALVPR